MGHAVAEVLLASANWVAAEPALWLALGYLAVVGLLVIGAHIQESTKRRREN